MLEVAGGDGTVSAVAAVAADTGRSLIVVPAGTSPGTWASICAIRVGRWTPWSTVSPRRWTWACSARVSSSATSLSACTPMPCWSPGTGRTSRARSPQWHPTMSRASSGSRPVWTHLGGPSSSRRWC
ncbi:hypothetical protein AB0937_35410 [Streptomyces sp. NPDC047880]|uniref:hypothetical protein n=1 Tax=Streptomyces sp. NPDC047880 TaxID=3155626 RepID=UPI00345290CC